MSGENETQGNLLAGIGVLVGAVLLLFCVYGFIRYRTRQDPTNRAFISA